MRPVAVLPCHDLYLTGWAAQGCNRTHSSRIPCQAPGHLSTGQESIRGRAGPPIRDQPARDLTEPASLPPGAGRRPADVADRGQVAALFEAAVAELGGLPVLPLPTGEAKGRALALGGALAGHFDEK
jgi:hypothetical protein